MRKLVRSQIRDDNEKSMMENVEREKSRRDEKLMCTSLEKNKRAIHNSSEFFILLYIIKKLRQPLSKISYSQNSWPMSRKWRKTRREKRKEKLWSRNIFGVAIRRFLCKFKFKDLCRAKRKIKNDIFDWFARKIFRFKIKETSACEKAKKAKNEKKWQRVTR